MPADANPYSPPSPTVPLTQNTADTPVRGSKVLRYNNVTLSKILVALFLLGILCAIVGAVSDVMQLKLLSSTPINQAEADWNDLRQSIFGFVSLGIFVLTAIFFGMFVVRAHHNVRGFGAAGMTITPGWAFGYFFIPILNLFRPYVAMSELWRASQSPLRWLDLSSGLVPLWWTLWILSNILGQMSFRLMSAAETIPLMIGATWVSLIDEIVGIPLSLVAMLMLTKIQRAQTDWVKS